MRINRLMESDTQGIQNCHDGLTQEVDRGSSAQIGQILAILKNGKSLPHPHMKPRYSNVSSSKSPTTWN
jgi:hypothetical protein